VTRFSLISPFWAIFNEKCCKKLIQKGNKI
jgi:hypothetical protein